MTPQKPRRKKTRKGKDLGRYVSIETCDRAWRNLCKRKDPYFTKSADIAGVLDVSIGTANRYRRVWHFLRLIDNEPGRFDRDEPSASTPAVITPLTREPEAFLEAVDDRMIWVANRSGLDPSVVLSFRIKRFGGLAALDGFRSSAISSIFSSRILAGAGEHMHPWEPEEMIRSISYSQMGKRKPPVAAGPIERSEIIESLYPGENSETTVPKLMALTGWSQSKIYRELNKAIAAGLVTRISRGIYRIGEAP